MWKLRLCSYLNPFPQARQTNGCWVKWRIKCAFRSTSVANVLWQDVHGNVFVFMELFIFDEIDFWISDIEIEFAFEFGICIPNDWSKLHSKFFICCSKLVSIDDFESSDKHNEFELFDFLFFWVINKPCIRLGVIPSVILWNKNWWLCWLRKFLKVLSHLTHWYSFCIEWISIWRSNSLWFWATRPQIMHILPLTVWFGWSSVDFPLFLMIKN